MPTYLCYAAAERLSQQQRAQVAEAITAAHSEEMAAPRYLAQVIFQDLGPGRVFIGGQPAPERQIWVHGEVRSGRTPGQRQALVARLARELARIAQVPADDVWVYLNELCPLDMVEFGHVLPPSGGEEQWLQALPQPLRARLARLQAR